jgi:chromosome segregation ATPase
MPLDLRKRKRDDSPPRLLAGEAALNLSRAEEVEKIKSFHERLVRVVELAESKHSQLASAKEEIAQLQVDHSNDLSKMEAEDRMERTRLDRERDDINKQIQRLPAEIAQLQMEIEALENQFIEEAKFVENDRQKLYTDLVQIKKKKLESKVISDKESKVRADELAKGRKELEMLKDKLKEIIKEVTNKREEAKNARDQVGACRRDMKNEEEQYHAEKAKLDSEIDGISRRYSLSPNQTNLFACI